MRHETSLRLNEKLGTPVKRIVCPDDLSDLGEPEKQAEMRRIFETPGIVIVDAVLNEDQLAGLREGLSDHRRKFKDNFNHGLPDTDSFRQSHQYAVARITELTRQLFGYEIDKKGDRSYRPLITEHEPLHYDTYRVECGQTALMSVLNFDVRPRVWNVGPSFKEICIQHPDAVQDILKNLKPGESPSVPLRTAGLNGNGPLRNGAPVHELEFAPGAVWYANPKTISHQIMYGGGAQFETWKITDPECGCQVCVVESTGLTIPNLERGEPTPAVSS